MKKNPSRKIIVKSYGKSKNRNPKFRVLRLFFQNMTSKFRIFENFDFSTFGKKNQKKSLGKFFHRRYLERFFIKSFENVFAELEIASSFH